MPIEDIFRNVLIAVVGVYAILKTVDVLFNIGVPLI